MAQPTPAPDRSVLSSLPHAVLRRKLARWYERHRRDLPWRNTRDPYAILLSEVMLQQTRVAAVIPYYHRFLARYPTAADLAAAPEQDVLAAWSGLGYYSRARNLRKAARQIASDGFPETYDGLLRLAGVGEYTAAAVASIALGLPHAAVDGNARRVIIRLAGSAEIDVAAEATALLDRRKPARSNQALMELGATVCLPKQPVCADCPVRDHCIAYREETVEALPPSKRKPAVIRKHRVLLVIRRRGRILLIPSPRVEGFWDLPEPFDGARIGPAVGGFWHAITNSLYRFEVREARAHAAPGGARWWALGKLEEIPLSTTAKKGLQCLNVL